MPPTTSILITGATGRIGANVAKHMDDLGHHVRALVLPNDPQKTKLESLGIETIYGDITSFDDVRMACREINTVFHLGAAFQAGGPFTPEQYMHANVQATFHVFEAARENMADVKHVVFSSTDATLDKYPPTGNAQPIAETTVSQTQTDWYAFTKILGERLADRFVRADEVPITVVRFPMVWGAGEFPQFPQFRLAYFLDHFKNRSDRNGIEMLEYLETLANGDNPLVIACDPTGRSWMKHTLDVRDIAHAFERLVGSESTIGNTYQLGAPGPFTWHEVVPAIARATGERVVEAQMDHIMPTFYEFDLSAAHRDFGYAPTHDWKSTLDEAIRFTTDGSDTIIPTVTS